MNKPGGVAEIEKPAEQKAQALIQCARELEAALLDSAREVSYQAAAQGRVDAIESVTGQSSLAKGAAELAQLIKQIEAKTITGAKR